LESSLYYCLCWKFRKWWAFKIYFTNKKPQVKNHLKNCPYFQEKIGGQEKLDDIINLTDNEIEEEIDQKRQKVNKDYGKSNEKVLNYLKSKFYIFYHLIT